MSLGRVTHRHAMRVAWALFRDASASAICQFDVCVLCRLTRHCCWWMGHQAALRPVSRCVRANHTVCLSPHLL